MPEQISARDVLQANIDGTVGKGIYFLDQRIGGFQIVIDVFHVPRH
jgi:hypothetical protein